MEDFRKILEVYKKKKYLFFNEPHLIQINNYEESLEKMVKKFSQIKDVSSIYSYTGAGVLGISDLDLFVLLKNDFENSKREDFSLEGLSRETEYLADITLQREDLFSKLYYRYHYRWAAKENTIHCLWGKEIKPEEISSEESSLSKIYYMAGVLLAKMPRDLVRSLTAGRISVRGLLKVIHTLRFTIEVESQITGIPSRPKWSDFVSKFADFRKNWFTLGEEKHQMLVDYLVEATAISFEIVEEFSNFVGPKGIIPPYENPTEKKLCGVFSGYKFYTIFYDQKLLPASEALKLNLELCENRKMRVLLLPSVFLTFMWQLGKAGARSRSEYIRNNLVVLGKEPAGDILPDVRKREELLNEYIEFLLKGDMIAINPGDAQGVFGFYGGQTLRERAFKKAREVLSLVCRKRMINYINKI